MFLREDCPMSSEIRSRGRARSRLVRSSKAGVLIGVSLISPSAICERTAAEAEILRQSKPVPVLSVPQQLYGYQLTYSVSFPARECGAVETRWACRVTSPGSSRMDHLQCSPQIRCDRR